MSHPGHNVLITGAGSGLGRGLSLGLAQQGHFMLATDLRLETVQQTVSQIQTNGHQAEAHELDVTCEESIKGLLSRIGRRRIDVLINNAGLQHVAKVEEFPSQNGTCCST